MHRYSLLAVSAILALFGIAPAAYAAVAASPSVSLTQGLVGYWTMDGKDINWTNKTIIDRSGYGNTGTLVGLAATTSATQGKAGQALTLNGITGYVSVPYNNLGSSFSYSVWFKPPTSGFRTLLGYMSSVLCVGCSSGVGYYPDAVTPIGFSPVYNNGWNHLVLVQTGTTCSMYFNGLAKLSGVACVAAPTSNGVTNAIGFYGNSGRIFSNAIDDVRIYNRALSAQEVKQLYSQGGGRSVAASPAAVSLSGAATAATTTATGLNAGLIGYWTMDQKDINWSTNKVIDRSGNGNTGDLTGFSAGTAAAQGKTGQTLNFNGVGTRVVVPHKPIQNVTTAASVFAWVRFNTVGGDIFTNKHQMILQKGDVNVNPAYYLWHGYVTSGPPKLFAGFYDTGSSYNDVGYAWTPKLKQWYYVGWTYAGGTMRVYIDGAEVASQQLNKTIASANTSLRIGHRENTYQGFFNGQIDDVRVYNRGLSAQEVKQLYLQGGGQSVAVSPAPSNTAATSTFTGLSRGLVGYWTMDGKDINWSTNTMIDRSGNGNTGTLVGLTAATSSAMGKIGQAMKFDGQVGRTVNINRMNVGSNGVTLSAWVKLTTTISTPYVSLAIATKNGAYGLEVLNGRLAPLAGTSDNAWNFGASANTLLRAGVWYHAVMTQDPVRGIRVYLNGVLDGTDSSYTGVILNPSANFSIGTRSNSNCYLNGTLDDVRIYNRALSAQEVQQLYNQGR